MSAVHDLAHKKQHTKNSTQTHTQTHKQTHVHRKINDALKTKQNRDKATKQIVNWEEKYRVYFFHSIRCDG